MTLSQPLIAYTPQDQLGGVGGMFYRNVVGVRRPVIPSNQARASVSVV